ncbi:hypothetical protein AK812_SmicGene32345 [Symbiodinium microadriaticum]|uniref:Uncharacterized protein n=1 Tax=Symbiodinium microadriaticum TaxID=2951 RepID=A0A1Q9CUC7_SYMMI|nr:hypothetical protein AK812_SmicGene32345 [Symbiodinium microadriaticum]
MAPVKLGTGHAISADRINPPFVPKLGNLVAPLLEQHFDASMTGRSRCWHPRFQVAGIYHSHLPGRGVELALVHLSPQTAEGQGQGSWAQPPPHPSDQQELSFADQVPMALRLSLAHTVASQPFDEVQFASKEAGERPHLKEDWEPSQETRAFHPQLAAAMEIKWKSSGPVDQRKTKLTEEEFLDKINPQLDVMVEMQAGAHEVTEARGAAVLRHLDTEKLRTLLKRNYLQGHQGEEFFAAQTSL